MKTGRTILDLEGSFQVALEHTLASPANSSEADALRLLIPEGYHPTVTLRAANGRRKNRNASAGTWSPESGEIVVHCTPNRANASSGLSAVSSAKYSSGITQSAIPGALENSFSSKTRTTFLADATGDHVRELCDVLGETERAGRSFIALKWFRDDVLAGKKFTWAQSAESRQAVLAKAIEQGAIITKKIPNPRAPQFPTTTVTLSRSHSTSQAPELRRYTPVRVKGEPLSATLLRDRGVR